MKKLIMFVAVVIINYFLFYGSSSAINIGDLDENLRITGLNVTNSIRGCVRPILILSIEDKLNVYITGEIVKSAKIISRPKRPMPRQMAEAQKSQENLVIQGGLYFDFKDEGLRKEAAEKIKSLIRSHEENYKLSQETGKNMPKEDAKDSFFWGPFSKGGLM